MKIRIDGRVLDVNGSVTVLNAARAAGIRIPSLCDHPRLRPTSGCRLCLIEVEGRKDLAPACATILGEGMAVVTDSPRIRAVRRGVLALILSEHPNACLVCAEKKDCDEAKASIRKTSEVTGCVLCPRNGRCDLQSTVESIGLDPGLLPSTYRNLELRRDDPFIDRNGNLCILCGRCVRVCAEVRGASVLTYIGRGPETVIGTAFGRSLLDSGCLFCGACVDVCPTGSLLERGSRYDLPSPERRPTVCALCSQGCAFGVRSDGNRLLSLEPAAELPPGRGQACVKGRFCVPAVVSHPRRILRPQVRRDGRLTDASWEEALDRAAAGLRGFPPGKIGVAVSDQDSCEDMLAAFDLAGAWDSRPIHPASAESAAGAWPAFLFTRGLSQESIPRFEDLAAARSIVVFGEDLAVTQPILCLSMHQAIRRGGRMILVSAEEAAIGRCASARVHAGPGEEAAFLLAMAKILIEGGAGKDASRTAGFAEFRTGMAHLDIRPLLQACGISQEKARKLAHVLDKKRPAAFLFGSGSVGGSQGSAFLAALWNLALLLGGTAVPLVSGANERGFLVLNRAFSAPARDPAGLEAWIGTTALPFFPAAGVRFLVAIDAFSSPATAAAEVILPQAVYLETGGTLVNAEGRILHAPAALDSAGESRPAWRILSELAARLGLPGAGGPSAEEVSGRLDKAGLRHGLAAAGADSGSGDFIAAQGGGEKYFLVPEGEKTENAWGRAAEESAPAARMDIYKGLNLAKEIKGLRPIREKRWPRS